MILIDTNVLIDVLANDPVWYGWSARCLARCSTSGPMLINEIVYAELSGRITSESDLTRSLADLEIELARTPRPALFIAGTTYRRYRAAGGIRTGVLPDFFIGAHAFVAGLPLLTRDVRRYRTYFPGVELIAP